MTASDSALGGGVPPPSVREILTASLPHMPNRFSRFLLRTTVAALRPLVIELRGVERLMMDRDPFILALNHNQRLEALIVPMVLFVMRSGSIIHFMADWNSALIPGIGLLMRHGQVLTVVRKDARPRFLNVLKPLYSHPDPVFVRARRLLDQGRSIGVFPEGTVNRDPLRLLPGHPGAARLSLQSGHPLLPTGLRFPDHPPDRPIGDRSRFVIEVGHKLTPPAIEKPGRPSPDEVRAWHDRLMQEISRLSGKAVRPRPAGSSE